MKREWKPGDVALASWQQFTPARAMFSAARGAWIDIDGAEFDGDEDELTLRPLVVIDPEDHEQVQRLAKALYGNGFTASSRLADALHEFANPTPPKPDEPTGLGAVVEDDKGRLWVRLFADEAHPGLADEDGPWKVSHMVTARRLWENVTAVRVLSEGVTAC